MHATGSTFVKQTQWQTGSAWKKLGTFTFGSAAGQGVKLFADIDTVTAADAIRFVPAGSSVYKAQAAYYHVDHLGTPQKLTDAAQAVIWDASYEPFGEVSLQTSLLPQSLRFPGQYFDAETGLHQNWHRDYDPSIGRYLQSDPIGLRSGLNTYTYVGDNPLNSFDADGLQQSCLPGVRCVGQQDNPNLPGAPNEVKKPKRLPCAEMSSDFANCIACCGTVEGQLASGGGVGGTCAEQCYRKEGLTMLPLRCPAG